MEDNYTFNVDIETQKSTTSVASLRKEIKELKSVLLTAEQGTKEYNAALEQLGSDLGQIKDVNELAKASTKDFGQQMANVTGTLKGISGGVQAITGGLSLMGVEMGEDTKVLKTLTSLMSMTQGIAAVESGIKAFKGLTTSIKTSTIAQKGLNAAMKANPIGFIIAGVTALAAGVAVVTSRIREAEEAQWRLNHAMDIAKVQDYLQHGAENFKNWQEELEYTTRLMKAQGKSAQEIADFRAQEIQKKRESTQAEIEATEAAGKHADEARLLEQQEAAAAEKARWRDGEKITNLRKFNKAYDEYHRLRHEVDEVRETQEYADELKKIEGLREEINTLDKMELENTRNLTVAQAEQTQTEKAATKAELERIKAQRAAAKKAWEEAGVQADNQLNKLQTSLTRLRDYIEKNFKGKENEVDFINDLIAGNTNQSAGTTMTFLDDIFKKLEISKDKLKEIGADYQGLWRALLDLDKDYLNNLKTGYDIVIQTMENEGKSEQEIQIAKLENEKDYTERSRQLAENRLKYIQDTGSTSLANEQAELEAQIALSKKQEERLQEQITYYKAVLAADEAYLEKKKELREQEKQTDYEFWDWQYENTWSNFEKQNAIKKAQVEAEKAYQEQLLAAAQKLGDKDTIDEIQARIQELVDELNNLSLDKSKATFKAWGDSIVKILGNVTDVMGSLMSYYATVTDEAVADLEDKLEQGIIDQETYDRESEKLKEEQFERNKQFQIAQALINGAAGIVQIIGDASLPSYWAKLAAIAATTLTTGIEIAAIQAQHYHSGKSSGGSSSGSGSGENWINVAPAYQMNDGTGQAQMTGAAVGNQLNSQRVYILESDIQSSNRRVQVRESNTRF